MSPSILLRKFILKCLVYLQGEGGISMHPFDFECVAHGMTLCMDFECYFTHATKEQPNYTLELYDCEL